MNTNEPILIMLVEDDEVDRYIVRRKLNDIGIPFELLEYTNGKDAYSYFEMRLTQEQFIKLPKLLIVDINMPLMDGLTFTTSLERLLKSSDKLSHTSVYILSSSDNERDITKSSSIDLVDGYISKPPQTHELKAALLQSLSR